jgi:membrane-associated phospholipid phosphatase
MADVTLGIALAVPLTTFALFAETPREFVNDSLIFAESVMVAGFLNQIVKTAVARPYPYLYGGAPYPQQNYDAVNYESFPSGHTAVPMAAMTSFAYLFHKRHPTSRWRYVFWFAGPIVALGAGAFQMSTGNHFPSDLVAGGLIGGAVGIINPWLHTF